MNKGRPACALPWVNGDARRRAPYQGASRARGVGGAVGGVSGHEGCGLTHGPMAEMLYSGK